MCCMISDEGLKNLSLLGTAHPRIPYTHLRGRLADILPAKARIMGLFLFPRLFVKRKRAVVSCVF